MRTALAVARCRAARTVAVVTTKKNPDTVRGSGPPSEVHERNRLARQDWLQARHNAQRAAEVGDVDEQRMWNNRADAIANDFVKANWGLARAGARAFLHTDADDHTAAGLLGLWEAFAGTDADRVGEVDDSGDELSAAGWDPDAGTFATFSRAHIQGRAARSVAALEPKWQGKSYTTFSKAPAVRAALAQLEAEGSPTSPASIAAKAGVTVDVVNAVLAPTPASLDAQVADGTPLGDIIADRPASAEVLDELGTDDVVRVASRLSVMDLLTMVLRHGLHGTRSRTLVQTADALFSGRGAVMNASGRVESAMRVRNPRRLRAVADATRVKVCWDPPKRLGVTSYEVQLPSSRTWATHLVLTDTVAFVPAGTGRVRVVARYEDGEGSSTLVLDDSTRVK